MKDKYIIGWYYKGVRDALQIPFGGAKPFEEYCRLIEKNFGDFAPVYGRSEKE